MCKIKKQKKVKNNGLNPMVYRKGDAFPQNGEKVPIDDLEFLVGEGEKLTSKLVGLLAPYGYNYYGTFVQTFALARSLAILIEISKVKGLDAKAMHDVAMPMFLAEAKEMVDEIMRKKGKGGKR